MINTELIPNVSVGGVKFGEKIDKYLSYKHVFFEKDVDDEYMEDFYEFSEPPLDIFVDHKNTITSITCTVECIWNGKNLIGLTLETFIKLFGIEPDEHDKYYIQIGETGDDVQEQDVYDFESLGMQIWAWENKIVTVICTNYDIEDSV